MTTSWESTERGALAPPGTGLSGAESGHLRSGAFRTIPVPVRVGRTLVCLDRSARSEACLPLAIHAGRAFGSPITLLHVLPTSRSNGRATDALAWEIHRSEAKTYLEHLQRELVVSTGLPVDVRLDQGDPAERIATLARQLDAHLIVLGSHGAGARQGCDMGTTAQQILSVARGSVLMARSGDDAASTAGTGRLMVPLDGSARAESVLPAVARLATERGAEVLLVHVVAEPHPSAVLESTEDLELARDLATRLESSARRYLERVQRQISGDVPRVRSLVVRANDERDELGAIAAREGVDLVVVSAHGCSANPDHAFGSVALHEMTHARVPVLVLQNMAEAAHAGTEYGATGPQDRLVAENG